MNIIKEIKLYSDTKTAKSSERFFKMGKGEYSEHDQFIGITIPNLRKVGNKYEKTVDLDDISILLKSRYNEIRYLALIYLGQLYEKTSDIKYVNYYLKNLKYVNNWNLVDISAAKILGKYLYDENIDSSILYKCARSKNVWLRRISIIATLYFIRQNYYKDTFDLVKLLMNDDHDLIHKACGWMLREVGKRDKNSLLVFLDKYYKIIPRIMLSYATEHLTDNEKRKYKLR